MQAKDEKKQTAAKARAQALTEEERKEIAAKGAAARWGIPKATHRGELVIGAVALAQHLHAVLGFMRACKSWDQFIGMLDIAFPKKGRTIPLQLE